MNQQQKNFLLHLWRGFEVAAKSMPLLLICLLGIMETMTIFIPSPGMAIWSAALTIVASLGVVFLISRYFLSITQEDIVTANSAATGWNNKAGNFGYRIGYVFQVVLILVKDVLLLNLVETAASTTGLFTLMDLERPLYAGILLAITSCFEIWIVMRFHEKFLINLRQLEEFRKIENIGDN